MSLISKEHLRKHNVIQDIFNYEYTDTELYEIYSYFERTFKDLLESYADIFGIPDPCFYIRNDCRCNAFAIKRKGYNIIGITNGYPILLKRKFSKENFEGVILSGLISNVPISDAYADLYTDSSFDISKFMLDCSLRFTFSHEFQHLLQFEYANENSIESVMKENFEDKEFKIKKHIWEYDADRMASFEVLKYIFEIHTKLQERNDDKLIGMMFFGCASMIITKIFFYLGITNQIEPKFSVKKIKFYTKRNSHPHPLVRALNIIEYFNENLHNDIPRLNIDDQTMFNNIFSIIKLYFNRLVPKENIINYIFDDLEANLETINNYNGELNELAVKDDAIRAILLSRNISFN